MGGAVSMWNLAGGLCLNGAAGHRVMFPFGKLPEHGRINRRLSDTVDGKRQHRRPSCENFGSNIVQHENREKSSTSSGGNNPTLQDFSY